MDNTGFILLGVCILKFPCYVLHFCVLVPSIYRLILESFSIALVLSDWRPFLEEI